MALKIILRPHERIIIDGAVITNGGGTACLLVENRVSILRESKILKAENADSPARKIYFVVQLMYMDHDKLAEYHNIYWGLVRDFVNAAPSPLGFINPISEQILGGRYYGALRLAVKLIEYEQSLLADGNKA